MCHTADTKHPSTPGAVDCTLSQSGRSLKQRKPQFRRTHLRCSPPDSHWTGKQQGGAATLLGVRLDLVDDLVEVLDARRELARLELGPYLLTWVVCEN